MASGAQRLLRIVSGEPPRRKSTEHQPCEEREAESKDENRGVQADFVEPGNVDCCRRNKQAYQPIRDENPESAARNSQQQAFGEDLTELPSAAGSESRANRRLA